MISVVILCCLLVNINLMLTLGSPIDKDIDWSKVQTISNILYREHTESSPADDVRSRQNLEIENKIVGGDTNEKPIPYQVGFLIQISEGQFLCGGALISSKHILSAAHCFDSIVPITPSIQAFFGAYNLSNKDESSQFRKILTRTEVKFHPKYDKKTQENDIVIITLNDPIKFTEHIQSIDLPPFYQTVHNLKGKLATASGWGIFSDNNSTSSALLRKVNVNILSQPQCRSFYDMYLQKTNICTDGINFKGPCNGDSGGPLVVEDGRKPILVGLTSFGSKIGCEKGWPSVYTRVGPYLVWIKENML